MFHPLKFRASFVADLHVPGRPRLEQVKVRAGEAAQAQVRPYVKEVEGGFVECADLYLAEGGTLLAVRMEYFSFA
jgi:hypothetical protein